MKKHSGILKTLVGLVIIAGLFFVVFYFQSRLRNKTSGIAETKYDQTEIFQNGGGGMNTLKTVEEKEVQLSASYLLSVPFASQAPFGDWSQPYQDACEEASIIITKHYLESKGLTKDEMKTEIDQSVGWQIERFGVHKDLDAQMTLLLARQYFGLNGKVLAGYNEAVIKKYISSGTPVIAPTAGRKLGNPNFTGAGPEYHMLVIIGYDDNQGIFITNDPGTRKGEKYIYKYQTLLDAVSGPNENMTKELIVLKK
ncbi:MAG: C39 family peptidase [Patescibacteria group bacterium]